MPIKSEELFKKAVEFNASDLHITVDEYPIYRVDGVLQIYKAFDVLTDLQVRDIIFGFCSPEQKELLLINKELDFSVSPGGFARFRVNAFFQKGFLAASCRRIPSEVPSMVSLNLPSVLTELCRLPQGLVLVTGPSGHGKSTTLASIIDYINKTRSERIITIEDPIEYIFVDDKSVIQQREMYTDTLSWGVALRSSLRQDPNVLLIGEMRDLETMASAVTIAETGHLVFATLHANSASQAVDRIIDSFPKEQQSQIRVQLSMMLEGVISQRLIPMLSGGRTPACEILLPTPGVRNLIREGKTYQIDNVISTSFDFGMTTLERSLAELVKKGKVSLEEAKKHTTNPADLTRMLSKNYAGI
jgi:twitching motility protein PilT